MITEAQGKIDATIAAGAVSSPWWLWYFDHATHIILVIGGIALLALRLAITWREWRGKREPK